MLTKMLNNGRFKNRPVESKVIYIIFCTTFCDEKKVKYYFKKSLDLCIFNIYNRYCDWAPTLQWCSFTTPY